MAAFLRFVLVGGGFALGYALLTAALISFAGAPALPSSIILYLLCIPLAFRAQKRFAFRATKTAQGAVWVYAATQIGSLVFVSTLTSRYVRQDFLWDSALYLGTAASAAVASFLICRFIIFRRG